MGVHDHAGELSSSAEMYLKTIFQLEEERGSVHAKDIAQSLGVTKPSVTGALKQLADKGLVNYARYEAVTLTPAGRSEAIGVIDRFKVLYQFLSDVLLIPEKEADEIACEMEHCLPVKVRSRLIGFLDYMNGSQRGKVVWDDAAEQFTVLEGD